MDTGTAVGFIIAGILVGIVGVGIGVNTYLKGTPVILKILYYFLPYSLALYAIFSDVISEANRYWPAPLIALFASMLNAVFSRGTPPESDLCGIPGLSRLMPSKWVPQIILFSTTILSYIAAFNTASGMGSSTITASWILLFVVAAIQSLVLVYTGNCFDNYSFVTMFGIPGGTAASILLGLALGVGIGGATGAGFASLSFFKKGAASSPLVIPATGTPSSPGVGSSTDPNVGTCSPPNDQDQFVCEAYKNGELVTTTITESFIGK